MNTPTPHPTAAVAAVDRALAARCTSSGHYLAGLVAAAMLDTVGQPEKLPALLFPDLDPDAVERVWTAALPVGFRLGRLVDNPRWTADALDRLRAALADAGYQGMGDLAARSRNTLAVPAHPADADSVREHR